MAHRDFVYDPPLVPFLDVLYEDDDIIVVNKASTILSVPGKLKIHRDSIMTRVKSIHPDAFVVHRLDYGTSGVLMLGLNKNAISNLGKQFIAREVHKVYVAWVAGKLEGTGAVDLPLILDLEHRPFQKVDFEVGKKALTYYQAMYYDEALDRTFVRLYPQTGRSHQLRVHMQQLGHPILGDHLLPMMRSTAVCRIFICMQLCCAASIRVQGKSSLFALLPHLPFRQAVKCRRAG